MLGFALTFVNEELFEELFQSDAISRAEASPPRAASTMPV
jgi:hypothetical protein